MTATQKPLAAAIAANRFGLGARPGELAMVERDPEDWLRQQLKGRPPELAGAGLKPSAETLKGALELRQALAQARREKKQGDEDAAKVAAALKLPALYRPAYIDESFARFSHAVSTDRPFLERLTQFWSNHFAVSVDKIVVLGIAGAMEREAIRPHVLGHFTDLLLAVEKHPAMLLYLDNQASIGPELARRAIHQRPRQGPQGGHQREPGARNPRAAHAGRGRRLHAGRRHHLRAGHLRLVHRRQSRAIVALRAWAATGASPANSCFARSSTSPARGGC